MWEVDQILFRYVYVRNREKHRHRGPGQSRAPLSITGISKFIFVSTPTSQSTIYYVFHLSQLSREFPLPGRLDKACELEAR